MDELNLTFYQYRNFTKEEVFNAKGFVYRIKDRILTLHQRKELINISEEEIKKREERQAATQATGSMATEQQIREAQQTKGEGLL